MAMSRSLQEEEEAKARWLASGRQSRVRQGRKNPRGGKKTRMVPPRSPPTLLLQDPEEARKQTEERVAFLLSEADEFPSTPPLPPSRLLALELPGEADCPLAVPKTPPSSLWERSSLMGPSVPGPVCVAGWTLPALPLQTDQRPTQSTAWPLLGSVKPEVETMLVQARGCRESPKEDAEGCSQTEGALQDLMELAGEGLTLTQWNSAAQPAEERGPEQVPGSVPQSGLDQSLEKKLPPLGSHSPPFLLGLLAAAFKGMVNNPHLSDVQFQVDSGELFYAHMFVLYARCPQLMEVVDQKGFWAAEEGGEAKTRRVLLSDVSGEAAGVFLNYLYTAEPFVPQHVLSEVAALAMRFGVAELAALCSSGSWSGHLAVGTSGQEEEERAEEFEELLKSVWVGEEEEDKALLPEEPGSEDVVDEQELEEIYEFAATQRKAQEKEKRRSSERNREAELGAHFTAEEESVRGDSSEGEGSLGLEPSQLLQGREARKEAVPGFPLDPLRGASWRRLKVLAEASRDQGEKSLLAVSWGDSLELFQQSDNGRDPSVPSDDVAGGDVAVIKSSTPLGLAKGLVPLSQNFTSGDSRVSLGVLADLLSTSPKWRGGFCSDRSLTLFSPALQGAREKPCPAEEQQLPQLQRAAPGGTAAGSGADSSRGAPAPLPSPVDLDGGLVLTLGSEEEGTLGQGEQLQAERRGFPYQEREAFGATDGPLHLEEDIPCGQSRGASLLGMLPGTEAVASGEGIRGPATPLLSRMGPNDGRGAKLGLTSRPEAHGPGDAQDSCPTQKSAVIPSPKRQSLQGWHPLGYRSPSPRSSTCLPRDGKSAADVVVILDDSEEEAEAAPRLSWGSSVLEADLPVSEDEGGHLFHLASPEGSVAAKAGCHQLGSPPRPLRMSSGTSSGKSLTASNGPLPHFGCAEKGSCSSDGSQRQGLDFGSEGDEMEILPLTQRLPASVPVPKTPDLVCQEREAPCRTPPTPMPSYSIMETPVLKKELSRFGVRTLPKKQMVLKLKEIFQYTHLGSDSRDMASSSQSSLCCGTQTALRWPVLAAACSGFPKQPPGCPEELPQVLLAGGRFGGSSGAGDQGKMVKQGCLPAGPGRQKRAAVGPIRGGRALAASQKADRVLGATGDTSVILQSSSTEFETSVLDEEDVPASQSACREADMLVALRQYIHSRPALRRQILCYQPFELARLQSELKQNGIRIALGRLLEFLDAHCITFTTAEARREKRQQQSGHQGGRKRRKTRT